MNESSLEQGPLGRGTEGFVCSLRPLPTERTPMLKSQGQDIAEAGLL